MGRESLVPFLPAALGTVTDGGTAVAVRANQPDYPGRFIVFQLVMFGAALLAAFPSNWARSIGFVLLLHLRNHNVAVSDITRITIYRGP